MGTETGIPSQNGVRAVTAADARRRPVACHISPVESRPSVSPVAAAREFLREYWLRFLIISVVVLMPCYWHKRIEAGDLPSHLYNAWLAHLIKTGQAPGLWLARRWNNVLFDFALSGLGNIVGWAVAEKVVTCGAVLIFFWGAFALVSALTRQLPWFYVPCLAMVAYGWTFEMGFMNNYISFGLAFFGLAILLRSQHWERAWAAAIVPLIWLAHPLGLLLLVSFGAYILLAEYLPPRRRLYPFVTAVLVLVAMHFFLRVHYPLSLIWKSGLHRFVYDGLDQLLLYGPQYLLPARLFRAFLWACLLVDLVRRSRTPRWWLPYLLPSELYALTLLGVVLLPTGINARILQQMGFISVYLLIERLTCVSAIFACCLLAVINPQKWHLVGFSVVAAIFFFFLYHDTAKLNAMEDQVELSVHNIAPGQRVVATMGNFKGSRVNIDHIVARACIEHCFKYDNYEPSTQQFRVRGLPGNPFVLTDPRDCAAAEAGKYVVQPADLPLFQVEQCDSHAIAMCIRELTAGEKNGRIDTRLGEQSLAAGK
jgi:hypothetical protein